MTTTPAIEACVICGIALDESHHSELVTTADPGETYLGAGKSLGRICQRCEAGRPLPITAKYSAYVEIGEDRTEASVILRIRKDVTYGLERKMTYSLERKIPVTDELRQLLTMMDISSIQRGEECMR